MVQPANQNDFVRTDFIQSCADLQNLKNTDFNNLIFEEQPDHKFKLIVSTPTVTKCRKLFRALCCCFLSAESPGSKIESEILTYFRQNINATNFNDKTLGKNTIISVISALTRIQAGYIKNNELSREFDFLIEHVKSRGRLLNTYHIHANFEEDQHKVLASLAEKPIYHNTIIQCKEEESKYGDEELYSKEKNNCNINEITTSSVLLQHIEWFNAHAKELESKEEKDNKENDSLLEDKNKPSIRFRYDLSDYSIKTIKIFINYLSKNPIQIDDPNTFLELYRLGCFLNHPDFSSFLSKTLNKLSQKTLLSVLIAFFNTPESLRHRYKNLDVNLLELFDRERHRGFYLNRPLLPELAKILKTDQTKLGKVLLAIMNYFGTGIEVNKDVGSLYDDIDEFDIPILKLYKAWYLCNIDEDIKALEIFEALSDEGYVPALYGQATCLSEGNNVEKDYDKAIGLLIKAGDQGFYLAQSCLADGYFAGEHGQVKNLATAFTWYKKAAKQNHMHAQFNIGCMYNKGEATEKNISKALKWWKRAGELGCRNSINMLAEHHWEKKNYLVAVDLYKKSADYGLALGAWNLSRKYQTEVDGFPKDRDQAIYWLRKAISLGADEEAQKELSELIEENEPANEDAPIQNDVMEEEVAAVAVAPAAADNAEAVADVAVVAEEEPANNAANQEPANAEEAEHDENVIAVAMALNNEENEAIENIEAVIAAEIAVTNNN